MPACLLTHLQTYSGNRSWNSSKFFGTTKPSSPTNRPSLTEKDRIAFFNRKIVEIHSSICPRGGIDLHGDIPRKEIEQHAGKRRRSKRTNGKGSTGVDAADEEAGRANCGRGGG